MTFRDETIWHENDYQASDDSKLSRLPLTKEENNYIQKQKQSAE
jgi:hypothetical protein